MTAVTTDARPSAATQEDRSRRRPDRVQRGFVVPVTALRKHLGSSRHVVIDAVVADLGALGVAVPGDAPVHLDLVLSSDPGGLAARGTVEATWVGECRRCGGRCRRTGEGGGARAIRARTGTTTRMPIRWPTTRWISSPWLRDTVLLELPLAPLCAETCLGLCPQCGTNWNESPCQCRPAIDPRWAALDELRDPPG